MENKKIFIKVNDSDEISFDISKYHMNKIKDLENTIYSRLSQDLESILKDQFILILEDNCYDLTDLFEVNDIISYRFNDDKNYSSRQCTGIIKDINYYQIAILFSPTIQHAVWYGLP